MNPPKKVKAVSRHATEKPSNRVEEGSGDRSELPHGQDVTMEFVAQKAGVSRSTVSRALRDHPAIPNQTQLRIKNIAKKLGYRPNPLVAVLMSSLKSIRRTRITTTIGLISSFPIVSGWKDNASVTRMVEGVFAQANRLGYHLETFCLSETGMTPARLSNILYTRRIQGIIILPMQESGAQLELQWPRFSPVTLGYSLSKPNLHRICNQLAHTIARTLDNVIRLGYMKIGLAMRSDTDERVDHSWRSGYLLYRDMYPRVNFLPMLLTREWCQESFSAWFEENRPEVVISDDVRVQEWVRALRLKIPKDVGLAHLDCTKARHAWAGINQHHEIMGTAAVDLVVGQLYRNETGIPRHPKSVMIEGSWVDGMTLVSKRKSSRQNGKHPLV